MAGHHLVGWVALAMACALAGCSGAAADEDPLARRVRALRGQVAQAVEAGAEGMEQAAPYTLSARWNPPPSRGDCDCPPYEVFYEGSWKRAIIEGSEAASAVLTRYEQSLEDDRGPRPPELVFVGTPTDEVRPCESTGQHHVVFALEAVDLP